MATALQSALAKAAESTKRACATSADVIKAAKPGTKIAVTGSKAAVCSHFISLAAVGGVIAGVAAYYLAKKYWLNKKQDTVKT